MVRFDEERFLHHHYVVALLNDLFGIQDRGGWQCAGPYGHRLLNIDLTRSTAFQREIKRGCRGIKPGWTRLNFNYFISETVFDYMIEAVLFVAEHGWKLMPDYLFEPETGRWRHRNSDWNPRMGLRDISYASGRIQYRSRHETEPEAALVYLIQAHKRRLKRLVRVELDNHVLNADYESLRWFPLPEDVPSAEKHLISGVNVNRLTHRYLDV